MAQNDYNNTLQNNNNLLEDILNMINNFPAQKEIILQSKTVSPTTSQQVITPDANYDGLDKVTINAATKQSKTVNPSTSAQIITPDSGYYGLSDVTVNGDSNLIASNIKNGVNIFGVTGSYTSSPTFQTANITTDMISQYYADLTKDYRMKITFPVPKSKLISFFLLGSSHSSNVINLSYFVGFRGQCEFTGVVYDPQWDGFACSMFNQDGTTNSNNLSKRVPLLAIDDDYSILTLITPVEWQHNFAYNKTMQYTYMI